MDKNQSISAHTKFKRFLIRKPQKNHRFLCLFRYSDSRSKFIFGKAKVFPNPHLNDQHASYDTHQKKSTNLNALLNPFYQRKSFHTDDKARAMKHVVAVETESERATR